MPARVYAYTSPLKRAVVGGDEPAVTVVVVPDVARVDVFAACDPPLDEHAASATAATAAAARIRRVGMSVTVRSCRWGSNVAARVGVHATARPAPAEAHPSGHEAAVRARAAPVA